jgi:vacuolar protein sorting-associated protein 54
LKINDDLTIFFILIYIIQAKLFLQSFHQIRISKSAKLVEDELWNPTEVTPGLQSITDLLVDSAVRDPPDLIIKSDDTIFSPITTNFPPTPTTSSNGKSAIAKSFSNVLSKLSSTNGSATATAASTTSSKHLRIEDRTYYVVLATSEVLTLLLDYLRVVVNLSMLTTDAMSRVIEFLKSFNSRTCQVVLGAGAMKSAGLKNISAKHLGSNFEDFFY